MIEYQAKNSFFAKGNYHFRQRSIPVELTGSYKSYSADAVEIHMWSDEEGASEIFNSSMRYPYSLWFDGKTELGEPVWMMGIHPKQITGFNNLDGDVRIFIRGDIDATAKPGAKIWIHAKTSQSSLIIPEWIYSVNYDGTITKVIGDEERKGINWRNEHGEARLIDNYEYVNGDRDNVTLRIRTNSLFLDIIPDVETELKAVLLQLPKFLKEDLSLLSFIGRRRIVCIEASARIKPDEKPFHAFARYQTWGGFYNLPSDQGYTCLINPQSLQQGIFGDLIVNYRKSPYKAVIDRTIPYLITTYEDGYVETHLVNAYAALESMVDGIGTSFGQEYLLWNNPFKRLSKKIDELVRQEISDGEVVEGIAKKIPELRRRSFIDRLLFLLNAQGVNTKLIWPPNTDEPEEFHKILKRRNLLIHTGTIDQGGTTQFDLNRIQKLVELWILKLLDCPDDALYMPSLYRDAPIDQLIHY